MKYEYIVSIAFTIMLLGCGGSSEFESKITDKRSSKVSLGESLFHDKSLSFNKTMSCATCHNQDNAFVDTRVTSMTLGASLGDDNISIGDRNTPSAAYAAFSPDFHFDEDEGLYIGGQFLDGRSVDLKAQAKGPFINPLEMGMPDMASVIGRIEENSEYVQQLQELFGTDIFNDNEKAYDAIAGCIEAFEKSSEFSSFDSKYDKFLAYEYNLSESEARGMVIFSNEDEVAGAGRCTLCHPITSKDDLAPLMTDYSYDNLGVPVNIKLRAVNGMDDVLDNGLFANIAVEDEELKGAFKVSSLRNVAVTSPYMHNGVFKDLKTVVHFYNTRDKEGAINPESSLVWKHGEFHEGRNTDELGNLGLSNQDEDDLVSFMKTFTDSRYEHLSN